MKVSGIICELNPLHRGHAYLMERAKEKCGALVMCMSGDCVQRGEFAIFSKEERARQALAAGADLVIELPLFGALSSAEGFARAGVRALDGLGVVNELYFGSECGDIGRLTAAAEVLLEHDTVARTLKNMKDGASYAAARERALYSRIRDDEVISSPNNILAVEYIKAILSSRSRISPVTVARVGAGHDEDGDTPSSGAIRRHLEAGGSHEFFIPPEERRLAGKAPWERLLTPSLLALSERELEAVPGVSEGLEHRLFRAIYAGGTWDEIVQRACTKRYPRSRIRRALLCAALGINKSDLLSPVPFIRVLGANDTGRALLRRAAKAGSLPIVTKPAAAKALGDGAVRLMEKTALAAAVRSMAVFDSAPPSMACEWRKMPVYFGKKG